MNPTVVMFIEERCSANDVNYVAVNLAGEYPPTTKLEDAWVFSGERQRFFLGRRPVISIARGAGWSQVELDGVPANSERDDEKILRFAQNIEIVPSNSLVKGTLPFFVAQGLELNPCIFNVRVALRVNHFSDLPDVEAHIATWDIGTRKIRKKIDRIVKAGHRESNVLTSPASLRSQAQRMPIAPALFLPVTAITSERKILGVLHLREELELGEFRATLHLTDQERIVIGTVLTRHVQWVDNNALQSREATVGILREVL